MTEKSIIWTDETMQLWCELKEAIFDLDKACIYDIAERIDRVKIAMREWEEVVYKEESGGRNNVKKYPMQPIVIIDDVARFLKNRIVRDLLDEGSLDLNKILLRMHNGNYTREEYEQITMLIGYSVSGFGDLSTSDSYRVDCADAIVERMLQNKEESGE